MPEQTAPAPDVPAVPRPADMPNAWLEGTAGVAQDQRIALVRADTMVGRSTACDVQIYDPKVSRKHFLIRYGNGAFFLQDQESSRGTFINGERVMAQRLKDGDRIEMGDSGLIFRIES
jgi:pSer/pThr/pTyr-binding forkhead associated (FHA) protein